MIDRDKIYLLTPDRGDRPEFLQHCMYQMRRQTVGPLHHGVVNYPPVDGVVDLVPRIKAGIIAAKEQGYEYVLIIENDDYYPDTYVEDMMLKMQYADITGIYRTIYYSLQYKCYRLLDHPGRASLFCSGFKISALDNFKWPADTTLYFDIELWKHQCMKAEVWPVAMPIGMKHGSGFCPGNFHNGLSNGTPMRKMTQDKTLAWLSTHVRPESLKFYLKMMR